MDTSEENSSSDSKDSFDGPSSPHAESLPTLVILSPRFEGDSQSLPWYHPPVRHLAFRYLPSSADGKRSSKIRLEVVLMDPQEEESLRDSKSRLYRTCLALLETLFRFGKGKMTGYKKRVVHDVSVFSTPGDLVYLLFQLDIGA